MCGDKIMFPARWVFDEEKGEMTAVEGVTYREWLAGMALSNKYVPDALEAASKLITNLENNEPPAGATTGGSVLRTINIQ